MPIIGPPALSERVIRDAKLYIGTDNAVDALERLVDSYGDLLAEVRQLRRRAETFDQESAQLDQLEHKLRAIAALILDL